MHPIRYIPFLSLSSRSVGVETHETSWQYRLISLEIRRKFSISGVIGLSPCQRHASLYLCTWINSRYRKRKGERETGSERDGSTYIHVGGGEERKDENKGEGKKKEESKSRVRNRQRPVFDDRSTGKNVLDRRRISVETRGNEGDRHLCEYRYNVVEIRR